MGRIIGPDKSATFIGKFREGDRVVVTTPPPLKWMPQPSGVVWGAVPQRGGYLIRYQNGKLAGWGEDELRPAWDNGLRRLVAAMARWWRQRWRR